MGRFLLLFSVLVLTSCGGGSEEKKDSDNPVTSPDTNPPDSELTSFRCSLSNTNLTVGDTSSLSCSTNLDGFDASVEISHSWSNDTIANLSDGLLTALTPGDSTLTLTASYNDISLTSDIPITVSEQSTVVTDHLSCQPGAVRLSPNQTFQPACYVYFQNGEVLLASEEEIASGQVSISFSSTDIGVASVTPQGLITANNSGTGSIQVSFSSSLNGLTLSDEITVQVESLFTDNAQLHASESSIWLGEGSSKEVRINATDTNGNLTDVDCATWGFFSNPGIVTTELLDAGDVHQYRITGTTKGFTHGYFGCQDGSLATLPVTIQVKDSTTLVNPPDSGISSINQDPQMWLTPMGYPIVSSYSSTEDRLMLTAVTGSAESKVLQVLPADGNQAGRLSAIGSNLMDPTRPLVFASMNQSDFGSLAELTFDSLLRPTTRTLRPDWLDDYDSGSDVQLTLATAPEQNQQVLLASDNSQLRLFAYDDTLSRFRQMGMINQFSSTAIDVDIAFSYPSAECTVSTPIVAQCLGSSGLWLGQSTQADYSEWDFRQVTSNTCNSVELAVGPANHVYLAWTRGSASVGEELVLYQIADGAINPDTIRNLSDNEVFSDVVLELDRNGFPRIAAVVENTSTQSRSLYQYSLPSTLFTNWLSDQIEFGSNIGPEIDFKIDRYGQSAIILQSNDSELAFVSQPAFVDYSPAYYPYGLASCTNMLPDVSTTRVFELDYDQDGTPDTQDDDSDNDGIPDTLDGDPFDEHLSGRDTDNDGIDNAIDTDDDNDGISDDLDLFPLDSSEWEDADGDGIGNNADTDNDNDGVPDTLDAFPFNASETLDTDGDGIGNNADTDDDNDSVPDSSDAFPLDNTRSGSDLDGDGLDDVIDPDDDGDGVNDDADLFPTDASESADNDGDGIGNNADTDDDNDGTPDDRDAHPFDDQLTGLDTDSDGIDNALDTDDDGDGYEDSNDSAPLNDQVSGHDIDGDSIDDAIDSDLDNDGIENDRDSEPFNDQVSGVDTDIDGIDDVIDGTINFRPVLSGSPSGVVAITNEYQFTPIGYDQDDQTLTYSVNTLPAWASFDVTTGTISGTPQPNDVGLTENIVISATDGIETTEMAPFSLRVTNLTDLILKYETAQEPALESSWQAWSLVVSNPTAEDRTNVVLTLSYPSAFESLYDTNFISSNGQCSGSTCDSGETLTWNIGTLKAGESHKIWMAPTVKDEQAVIALVATVTDDSERTVILSELIDVEESKPINVSLASNVYPAKIGETLRITASYAVAPDNKSSNNSTISLSIPENLEIQNISHQGVASGDSIVWSLGDLIAGDTGSVSIEVEVKSSAPAGIQLESVATFTNAEQHQTSATSLIPIASSKPFGLDIEVPTAQWTNGDRVSAKIILTNTSGTDRDDITLALRVPRGMIRTYDNGSWVTDSDNNCWDSYCDPGEQFGWTIDNLPAGESTTVNVITDISYGQLIEYFAEVFDNGSQLASSKRDVQVREASHLSTGISASTYPAESGETIQYQISYGYSKTTSNSTNTNLTLDLPAGLTINSTSNSGVIDTTTNSISWALGTLTPGQTGQELVEVTLDADLDVQHLEALAQLSNDADASGSAVTVVPVASSRKLDMELEVDASPAEPGEGVHAVMTVTNRTNSDMSNVYIQFRHPPEMVDLYDNGSWTSDTTNACYDSYCNNGDRVGWTIETLPAGQSASVDLQSWVDSEAVISGEIIEFWAKAAADGIQYASAKQDIQITSNRYLSTAITASTYPAEPGETIQYQVSYGYSNTAGNSTDTRLILDLAGDLSIISVSGGGSIDSDTNTITWPLGVLTPGQTGLETVQVVLSDSLTKDHIDSQAWLLEGGSASGVAKDTVPIIPSRKLDMELEVDASPAEPGEGVHAVMTVTNRTNSDMSNVYIQFRHPPEMVDLYDNGSWTSDTTNACYDSYCNNGDRVGWTIATLPAGQSASVDLQSWVDSEAVISGEIIEFWAKAAADGIQYASARQDIQITSNRYLSTAISANTYPAEPGETIQYQVSYGYSKTTGNSTNTQLTLELPPQLTIVSASNGGVVDRATQQVSWNLGALSPGTTGQTTVEVTLSEDLDIEHLDAIAQLESDGNAIATAVNTVPIVTERQVDMTISVAPSKPKPGEQIIVSIRVDNNSDIDMASPAIRFRHPHLMAKIYDNGGSTADTSNACIDSYCDAGDGVSWTGLSISSGNSKTVEMTTVVDGTATPGQLIEFWAKVEEAPESGDIQRASARAVIGVD